MTVDATESIGAGVDTAGQPHAGAITLDFDTECGLYASKGTSVYGIPTRLNIGVSCGVLVGSNNVRRPISDRTRAIAPDTSFVGRVSRLIDVEMGSCRIPVACSRHRNDGAAAHTGRDEHCLVARKHGLADCHNVSAAVDCFDIADAFDTVILTRKWLRDYAILVTVCSSIHGFWINVCGPWLPLIHKLTWRAGVRTIGARGALLIWAQGPSGVQLGWSDGHQTCILREFTLSRSVDQSALDQLAVVSVSMVSGMPIVKMAMAQGCVGGLGGQRKQSRAS